MIAEDIMDRCFHYLRPSLSIEEAVQEFEKASRKENKKIFGMMVMDENDQLAGMLSMYDILQFIRPKNIEILGQMEDLSYEPVFSNMVSRINNIRVDDIMSCDLVTVTPETHLMVLIDTMVQKHIRRLPVVKDKTVVGVLYRSDVFYSLMKKLA